MQLILVRHGEAERVTQEDAARQLTARGRLQADWMAQQILSRYQPSVVIHSPLKRAKQTAQALIQRCPDAAVWMWSCLQPDDPVQPALKQLSQLDAGCVAVVCHMNIVAHLAAALSGDNFEGFDLAEARVFEFEQDVILPASAVEQWRCVPPFFSA